MAEEWQSQSFRQNVISKIHDMLPQNGPEPNKNASTMENHIFRKSRTKDEYLGLVAKLFMHYKDMSQRKSQAQQQQQQQQQQLQQQQQQQQPPPPNAEMGQHNIMQDPLNALQNLASQGNRNPQLMPMGGGGGAPGPNQMAGPGGPGTASNLLQSLNQQRPGQQQMQPMPNIRGQLPLGAGAGGQQQMVQVQQQMAGGNGPGGAGGMQLNAMGPAVSQGQGQIVGNAGGMPNQMVGPGPNSGPAGGAAGGMPNQMSPMVMGIGNPMMRLNQGMQGMPSNMQQQQHNVVGGPAGQQQVGGPGGLPPNAVQQGGAMNPMGGMNVNMPPNMQQKANMVMGQAGQMFPGNRGGVVGGQQQPQQQQ